MIKYLNEICNHLEYDGSKEYDMFIDIVVDIKYFRLHYKYHTSLENKHLYIDGAMFCAEVKYDGYVYVNDHAIFKFDFNKSEFYCIYGKETTFRDLLNIGVVFSFI